MADRGADLMTRLLKGDQSVVTPLLRELHRGYPPDCILSLLRSTNEDVAKAGAWLASEIGAGARPILQCVLPSLAHSNRYVRYFLLDVVLTCATSEHGNAVAIAVEAVRDPDEAVQAKAVDFLYRASIEQLRSAIQTGVVPDLAKDVGIFVTNVESGAADAVRAMLDSEDRTTRLLGVAAAARLRRTHPSLLAAAVQSSDETVKRLGVRYLDDDSR